MKEDVLEMTSSDRKRLHVIRKAESKEIKQSKAAEMLGISVRQVKRLVRSIRSEGDGVLIHKLRGGSSNHAKDPELKERVVSLYQAHYEGFGPTLAAERLQKEQKISILAETLRSWLKEKKVSYPSRRSRPHRQWRKRKEHRGEMIQLLIQTQDFGFVLEAIARAHFKDADHTAGSQVTRG